MSMECVGLCPESDDTDLETYRAMIFGLLVLACALITLLATFIFCHWRSEEEKEVIKVMDLATLEASLPRMTVAELGSFGEEVCCICLGALTQAPDRGDASDAKDASPHTPRTLRRLPCGHFFHATCIDSWVRAGHPCAMCRAPPFPNSSSEGESQQVQVTSHVVAEAAVVDV